MTIGHILYALIVITTIISGGVDGGAHVSIQKIGEFPQSACETAARQIEARGTYAHWENKMGIKGGSVKSVAFCVPRA